MTIGKVETLCWRPTLTIMTRISLVYPKIPDSTNCPSGKVFAFEKCDGTNLHWVYDPELGFYAFGTRRDRFDLDSGGIADFCAKHQGLEEAPDLFLNGIGPELERYVRSHPEYRADTLIVFTEFLGAGSFAGKHRKDDPKRLVLFDVQTDDGFLCPETFVSDFSDFGSARVVYQGKLTGKFIGDVREGVYGEGEGVICKACTGDFNPWMIKIKTNTYREKLKLAFGENWEDFWE